MPSQFVTLDASVLIALSDPDDAQPWRLASLRASTGLGLPDCCVLDTARQISSAVATFDARLVRRARELGVDLAL